MKVLHVQKAAGVSGAERHLLTLLPALARAGVDVSMCVLVTGEGQSYVDRLSAAGVCTTAIPAGPDVNPAVIARLAALVRRLRPDLVHTHLVHADVHGQLAAALVGVPGVSSVHGRPAFYRRRPYLTAGRLVGRLVRRRIAISEAVAAFLRELRLGRPGRIDVVPYGINSVGWQFSADEAARARHDLGISADDVVVGMASRLIAHKGHDTAIEAVALAAAAAPELRLLVAGAGPLDGELARRAIARAPQRVRFLGFVADVHAFMAACDVIAFPADPELGEGFGLAALEAMAAGRPVVATPTGALDELVVQGETGLLVPPKSPRQLAEALITLARDPALRRRMGEAGASRAADRYGVDAMVEATLAVYRSAVARR